MPIDASIISTPNLAVLTGRRSMESLGELIAVGAGLAVISALIVARTPSRRLIWVMLLWLLAPAILMAGMMALGALLNPRHDEPLSQAIFGVMLIGVFVAVPWMLVCAAAMPLVLRGGESILSPMFTNRLPQSAPGCRWRRGLRPGELR